MIRISTDSPVAKSSVATRGFSKIHVVTGDCADGQDEFGEGERRH